MAANNRDLNFTLRFRIDSDKALQQLNRQFKNLNTSAQSAQKAADALKKVANASDDVAKKTKTNFDKAGKSVVSFGTLVKGALAYISVGALRDAAAGLVNVQKQFDRANTKLTFAVRDEDPSVVYDRLAKSANRLGLVTLDLVEQFGGFAAAAMSTGKSTKELEQIFYGIAEAGVALKLTPDDMKGAFYAIQQMMSKGVVQSEEFRLQLAERLPIAVIAGVNALQKLHPELDVTPKLFQKMLVNGEIITDKFLPKFSDELRRLASASLPAATNSFIAESNRWKNTLNEMSMEINNGGFIKGLSDAMKVFNDAAKDPSAKLLLRDLGAASGELIKMFAEISVMLGGIATRILELGGNITEALAGDATKKAWADFEKDSGRAMGDLESSVLRIRATLIGIGSIIMALPNAAANVGGFLTEKVTGNKDYFTNANYGNPLQDLKKVWNGSIAGMTGLTIGDGATFYTDLVNQKAAGLAKTREHDKGAEKLQEEIKEVTKARTEELKAMGLVTEAARAEYLDNERLKVQYDQIKAANLDGAVAIKAYSMAASNKNNLTTQEIIAIAKQEVQLNGYTEAVKKNASEQKKAARDVAAERKKAAKELEQNQRRIMGADDEERDIGQTARDARGIYQELQDKLVSYKSAAEQTKIENDKFDASLQRLLETANALNKDGKLDGFIEKTKKDIEQLKDLRDDNEDWVKVTQRGLANLTLTAEDKAQRIADVFVNAFTSAEDALVKFVTTGKLEVGDMLRSISEDLARYAIRQGITQPLANAASSYLPQIASYAAAFFHEGGVVGSGGTRRGVSPSVFAGAPRYHNGGIAGLKPDEVPAILQRGERVIPRNQSAAGMGTINNTFQVEVNMNGGGGKDSQDSSNAELMGKEISRQLEGMVTQVIQKQMRPGGLLSSGKSY